MKNLTVSVFSLKGWLIAAILDDSLPQKPSQKFNKSADFALTFNCVNSTELGKLALFSPKFALSGY